MEDKGKRSRGANYSMDEKSLILSLVDNYKGIIENKQTNGTAWKAKEKTWIKIQTEFNASSTGNVKRLVSAL